MQKIFKIEKVTPIEGFKPVERALYKKKRKARNARRFKSQVEDKKLKKLIEKQTKLHSEEKLLLEKQEQMYATTKIGEVAQDNSDTNLQLLKSESVLSIDQETKDTNNQADTNELQMVYNSKITITSIDAAILEGLNFIENAAFIRESQVNIPIIQRLPDRLYDTPEYTLVLDLDETLVHWSISPFEGYDEIRECIYISYRPFLIEFLEKVSQYFEVVVFTASEKEYATMVLDRIDPDQKYIHHRLFRDSCLPINGNYIKDLNVLGRNIDKTIIIDNSVIAFSLNLDNGIPIHSFSGDKQDCELHKLVEIMDYALNRNNVNQISCSDKLQKGDTFNLREYLTSMFGLKERIHFWKSQYMLRTHA